MSNNKQSSVEQLMWELWDTPKDKFTWYTIMKYYNERHKQEMIDFTEKCLDKALDLDVRTAYSKIEQYYNETFE